jgi:hypothetical protein
LGSVDTVALKRRFKIQYSAETLNIVSWLLMLVIFYHFSKYTAGYLIWIQVKVPYESGTEPLIFQANERPNILL